MFGRAFKSLLKTFVETRYEKNIGAELIRRCRKEAYLVARDV
jgi:hypothetical protein